MELVVRYKEAEHWLWSETFLPLSNEPWATHSLHHYSGHSLPCAWEVWEEFQWFLPFKMMILNAVVFFMQCVCAQVAQCHPCWHRVPRPVQGSGRLQCERRMYFSCSRDCIQMKTLFFIITYLLLLLPYEQWISSSSIPGSSNISNFCYSPWLENISE